MDKLALVITQQSVRLYRLGSPLAEQVPTPGPQDDIKAWVARYIPLRAYCSIVSDTMDMSYVQSTLPPIWFPGTRLQLLERRLVQQLRDTTYRAAVLAPSGSWQPPTRASLIGMGQSGRIDEWVAAMHAQQVHIKGLWPMSALIALSINKKAPRRLRADAKTTAQSAGVRPTLALVATPAGLRQVLLRGKTPLFSRLVLNANVGDMSIAYVLTEARRTVQYLVSQSWLSSTDQPVATQMWLPFEHEGALAALTQDSALDVQSYEVVPDTYARLLPLLNSVSAQLQFLPKESRTAWRAAQIAKASRVIGLAALAISGLWCAEILWESWGKRSLTQQQLVSAAAINQQARQEVLRAKGDLSQAGLAVATVQAWRQTLAVQPDQFAAMQHLAGALQLATGAQVQKIRWDLPRMVGQTAAAAATPVEPFACPKVTAGESAAPEPPPATEPVKPALALLNVSISLPADIAQRQALQLQTNLLAGLNSAGWSAHVIKSTVNFEATQSQVGKLGESAARTVDVCLEKVTL